MYLTIDIAANEKIDSLTFASAIVNACNSENGLDPIKVAKAILLETVGDVNA